MLAPAISNFLGVIYVGLERNAVFYAKLFYEKDSVLDGDQIFMLVGVLGVEKIYVEKVGFQSQRFGVKFKTIVCFVPVDFVRGFHEKGNVDVWMALEECFQFGKREGFIRGKILEIIAISKRPARPSGQRRQVAIVDVFLFGVNGHLCFSSCFAC